MDVKQGSGLVLRQLCQFMSAAVLVFSFAARATINPAQQCKALLSETANQDLPFIELSPRPKIRPEVRSEIKATVMRDLEIKLALAKLLSQHITQNEISLELTANAIKKFIEILDPMGILFLQSELNQLHSPEHARDVYEQVTGGGDFSSFQTLVEQAKERFGSIVDEFATSANFRNQVIYLHELESDLNDKSHTERVLQSTPENLAEARQKVLAVLSRSLADQIRVSSDDPTKAAPITSQEGLILLIRELRSHWTNEFKKFLGSSFATIVVKAYLRALDPHSDLLLPFESGATKQLFSSKACGFAIESRPTLGGFAIRKIIEGGAAHLADLRVGDIITHISKNGSTHVNIDQMKNGDWENLRNVSMATITDFTFGEDGSTVYVKVLREGKVLRKTLTRRALEWGHVSIETKILPSPVGDILLAKLDSFFEDSGVQLKRAIQQARSENNVSGIILDLRGNGGGKIKEVAEILGLFIASGPAYILQTRDENTHEKIERVQDIISVAQPLLWIGPLIVLIDSGTASASETLAKSLQDYGRAIVVGSSQSMGKGSAQSVSLFTNGLVTKVTTAMFFSPAGASPQVVGVQPDIKIDQAKRVDGIYERDFPGVLPPVSIKSYLSKNFPLMPGRHHLIGQLKFLRSLRSLSSSGMDKSAGDKDPIATEAYKILLDYIELDRDGN